jgi:ESCRT-I complex subunit TSG101
MKVPGVDEVLVAPTVVGQQMYELVAEERACAEAREVLGRALDRGRVGAEAWVRAMRGLGREEFQKKVLVRKAAKGLGLVGTEDEAPGGGAWI